MIWIESVMADIAGGDAEDGYAGGLGDLLFQAVEVPVDGLWFPAGVREDRVIGLGQDAVGGEGEQGAGLNAGTERYADERGRGGNWYVLA